MSKRSGTTRTVIERNYALITPDGHVPSVLPGWKNCVVHIHIAPVMGGPRFTQLTITPKQPGLRLERKLTRRERRRLAKMGA